MPPQEDRISTLEFNLNQFKTETIKAYGDMAFEMTIVKGLTQDAITRLATLSQTVEKRFDEIKTEVGTRLDGTNAHLESLDSRLSSVETKVDTLQATLDQILERLPKASE